MPTNHSQSASEDILNLVSWSGRRLLPFRQDDLQAFIEVREVLELKVLDVSRSKFVAVDLQRMWDANMISSNVPLRIAGESLGHARLRSRPHLLLE